MSVLSAGEPADRQAGRRLVAATRQRRLSQTKREWFAAYLFLLPDLLGLLIFIGLPMILSLSLGFFNVSGFG
jgi:multiple sugar transport system permease protein